MYTTIIPLIKPLTTPFLTHSPFLKVSFMLLDNKDKEDKEGEYYDEQRETENEMFSMLKGYSCFLRLTKRNPSRIENSSIQKKLTLPYFLDNDEKEHENEASSLLPEEPDVVDQSPQTSSCNNGEYLCQKLALQDNKK